MTRLFWRIFLSFWLCFLLIGGVLVFIAVTTDPKRADLGDEQQRLEQIGGELSRIYHDQGPAAARQRSAELGRARHQDLHLFLPGHGVIGARPAPRRLFTLAERALDSGQIERRPSRNGFWYALPLPRGEVLLAMLPPPDLRQRLLNPHSLILRLLVTFVIAGLVCWGLSRSLTAPLQRLRQTTRRLARGELEARVGPIGNSHDEVAELSRDFDRMAERIQSLIQGQKRLLGDISHELRSPLARISVALELARQKSGAEDSPALARIEQESERLNSMIGDILALSRLEQLAAAPRDRVALSELLQGLLDDLRYEAQTRRLQFEIDIPPGLSLAGEGELLQRALENILRNGLRYSPEGGIIRLAVTASANAITIAISDQGPGVPEADLEHLFEPFFRVASARDRQSGGAGLGLAIAARAVAAHGGHIHASNSTPHGLTVTIELPNS